MQPTQLRRAPTYLPPRIEGATAYEVACLAHDHRQEYVVFWSQDAGFKLVPMGEETPPGMQLYWIVYSEPFGSIEGPFDIDREGEGLANDREETE